MVTSRTSDFDRFVYSTLARTDEGAFLVVLLQMKVLGAGQFATRFAASVIENVVKGFDLVLFRKHLKEAGVEWELAVVRPARVPRGSNDAIGACQLELERIEQRVSNGDFSGTCVFTRNGVLFDGLPSQKRDFSNAIEFDAGRERQNAHSVTRQTTQFTVHPDGFDAFVREVRNGRLAHSILVLYLRTTAVDAPNPAAVALIVAGKAAFPCDASLTLSLIKDYALQAKVDWDMIAVNLASNRDGSAPSNGEMDGWLEDMRRRIESGDPAGLTIFTREGTPLQPTVAERGVQLQHTTGSQRTLN